jgi:hypothetical protein
MGGEGRVPGRININSVRTPEVILAAADAQPVNHFTDADVSDFFNRMIARRNGPDGIPFTADDQPFSSAGIGVTPSGDPQFPAGTGIQNTVLSPDLYNRSMMGQNPHIRYELMNKLYNNLTTRSNVFGVWVTIGFFEVTGTGPGGRPLLGREMSDYVPSYRRAKYFAVIDRTNLTIHENFVNPAAPKSNLRFQGNKPFFFGARFGPAQQFMMAPESTWETVNEGIRNTAVPHLLLTPATSGVNNSYLSGIYDGKAWILRRYNSANPADPANKEAVVYIDTGVNQEHALVTQVIWRGLDPTRPILDNPADVNHNPPCGIVLLTGCNITPGGPVSAPFKKTHPPGFTISNVRLGNPGPQPNFDYKSDPYTAVVPYAERTQ